MGERILADIESPWNFWAKRFIEAPVYRLTGSAKPHPNANRWRLVMEQDGVRHVVENDEPVLDAAPIWPRLKTGAWIQTSLYELDRETGWCVRVQSLGARVQGNGTMIGLVSKAPDWDDHDEAPLDYAASVRACLGWLDAQEQSPGVHYREPGMPAWWWHAAESDYPPNRPYHSGAYPGLSAVALGAYLWTARILPEQATHCREIATAIGDWLLRNRTPMTGALPGLPYTAMRQGVFVYSSESRAINISRAAIPGFGMLLLHQETGEPAYLEYAQHVAEVLHGFVRPDGSMPYRVRPDTGAVVENYTCGHVRVALFLEALDRLAPDPRWRDAATRILGWVVDHPLVDYNWKACFEDVGRKRRFANLTGMDALWAIRLLARHATDDPTLLPQARKLFRWVEDQFVNFGDDASLGRLRTYYPAVREQYDCDYPMDAHAANYASTCWDLYQATGEETFRHKMVATLNAIVKSQRADGAYSTWGRDRETGLGGFSSGHNWFGTSQAAMAELASFVMRERGETPLPG